MKPITSFLLPAVLALLLAGCAAPSGYGLASSRAAAVASAADAADTPVNPQATYLNLIQQMQQKGLWFASLAHIDAFEQQNGSSPDTLLLRGDALRQTGQPDGAAEAYRKLMGTPAEAAGYRGLGLIAGAQGDFSRAVQMLEQAQRRSPTDVLVLSDLAYAYMRAGRLGQARVPVMQASQLQPDLAKVQGNLVLFLLADGQQVQARAVMARHDMAPSLRAAIEQEARLVNPALPVVPTDAVAAPLVLKTSSWPLKN
jgi:Flp pilus assembly protein TadD